MIIYPVNYQAQANGRLAVGLYRVNPAQVGKVGQTSFFVDSRAGTLIVTAADAGSYEIDPRAGTALVVQ